MSRRNWLWYVLSGSVLVLTAALGYAGWRQMELGTARAGLYLPAYGRNLALSRNAVPLRNSTFAR
jgi:tellurite resistance protein TehA-like permease